MRFSLHVPNGNYRVTFKMADGQVSKEPMLQHLESQGKLMYRDVNIQARAGGVGRPLDLDLPASVTDGTLSFAVRGLSPDGFHAKVSAIVIQPDPGVREIRVDNPTSEPVPAGGQRQLHAVGWFSDGPVNWTIISGPGSISATGLYTAPPQITGGASKVVVQVSSLVGRSKPGRIEIPLLVSPPVSVKTSGSDHPDGDLQED